MGAGFTVGAHRRVCLLAGSRRHGEQAAGLEADQQRGRCDPAAQRPGIVA
jgi:hypothetical protein